MNNAANTTAGQARAATAQPWSIRRGELPLQGFRYHYALSGTASGVTPVLLVSGAFQSMKTWRR